MCSRDSMIKDSKQSIEVAFVADEPHFIELSCVIIVIN